MKRTNFAFTLVELLVVIAIIGVLVGMALPGVQAMRESSRRSACSANLIPMGMAIQTYHDRWLEFPVGTIAGNIGAGNIAVGGDQPATRSSDHVPPGTHHNWLGRLLDLLDQPAMASTINRSVPVDMPPNDVVLRLGYPGVRCPSSPGLPSYASDYAGLHHSSEAPIAEDNDGVFILNRAIHRTDVIDGLANTIFIGEKISAPDDPGWLSGTRATLRNGGQGIETINDQWSSPTGTTVGSLGSYHPGGANLMFGSGEISFRTSQMDLRILSQMIDRRDGSLPTQWMSLDDLRKSNAAAPNPPAANTPATSPTDANPATAP